jgi:hypothetical protein
MAFQTDRFAFEQKKNEIFLNVFNSKIDDIEKYSCIIQDAYLIDDTDQISFEIVYEDNEIES